MLPLAIATLGGIEGRAVRPSVGYLRENVDHSASAFEAKPLSHAWEIGDPDLAFAALIAAANLEIAHCDKDLLDSALAVISNLVTGLGFARVTETADSRVHRIAVHARIANSSRYSSGLNEAATGSSNSSRLLTCCLRWAP